MFSLTELNASVAGNSYVDFFRSLITTFTFISTVDNYTDVVRSLRGIILAVSTVYCDVR